MYINSRNWTLFREGQLQRFLLKLKNKSFFTVKQYKDIYPTGSQIYGLQKIHKIEQKSDTLSTYYSVYWKLQL